MTDDELLTSCRAGLPQTAWEVTRRQRQGRRGIRLQCLTADVRVTPWAGDQWCAASWYTCATGETPEAALKGLRMAVEREMQYTTQLHRLMGGEMTLETKRSAGDDLQAEAERLREAIQTMAQTFPAYAAALDRACACARVHGLVLTDDEVMPFTEARLAAFALAMSDEGEPLAVKMRLR